MILVIPCYNEALRLPIDEYVAHAHLFDGIVFVDDGSSDNTLTVLLSLQQQIGLHQCHIKTLNANVGKGEAIRQGVLHYLHEIEPRSGSAKRIGTTDADLSTPLQEMHRLAEVHANNQYDMLQGSRVALMGRNIQRSAYKHYLGRIGATLISELLELPIYDTQAGAKVFSIEAARTLFDSPFISRWLFDCELYVRGARKKFTLYEEPLTTWIDQAEGSKIKASTYLISLFDLYKIYRTYK